MFFWGAKLNPPESKREEMIITRELLEKQIQEYTEASLEAKGTMIANDGAAQALKLLLPLLDTHEVVDE